MKFFKILIILFFSLLLNSNSYSKPYKTKIVFESEYGGIYALKNPTFTAPKGRYLETFEEINNISEKNCSNYSKKSFFFVKYQANPRSAFTIQKNGNLKEWSPGFIPDDTIDVKVFWNHYRFYCGENIEEVLVNHNLKETIFPNKLFHIEHPNLSYHVADHNSEYVIFQNKQFTLNNVTKKNREKIKMTLLEKSELKTGKQKTDKGYTIANTAGSNFGKVLFQAKKVCKDIGFKSDTINSSNCILDLVEVNNGYEEAKIQENLIIQKAKKEENIDVEFTYTSKSGNKINRESKWTKFWQGAAWILYEHGDDIFRVILDAKYDTNYSGYNTKTKVSSINNGAMRCVSQRVGNVIHQNCKGNGVHIYCMYQKLGSTMVKRNCREK